MPWSRLFKDGPEYTARIQKGTYALPNISVKQIHEVVPKRCYEKSTFTSLQFICRHIACAYATYRLGLLIQVLVSYIKTSSASWNSMVDYLITPGVWLVYWCWQGIIFAGLWCLGHEAGHNSLSPYKYVNTTIGVLAHTFVLTPYFSWRVTHNAHHKATNNIDRDETYIPLTDAEFLLSRTGAYAHSLEETPVGTLTKLVIRQFFGFQLYLLHNRKGNKRYPPGTSHYIPSSLLFKPKHYRFVVASNLCIIGMLALLTSYGIHCGWKALFIYYLFPWLWAHNWIVLFTYLQHSDPTIPYYRKDLWTFTRGALATVDRPLFGWVGHLFLYNISSHHIAHHLFPGIPFYNLPDVTRCIRPVLGDNYIYDSTPAFYALWRSFTQCVYVAPDALNAQNQQTDNGESKQGPHGNVLFFHNAFGKSVVRMYVNNHEDALHTRGDCVASEI